MSERTFRVQMGTPIGEPHPDRPLPTITVPANATDDEIHEQSMRHALAALGEGICPHCAHDLRQAIGQSEDPHSYGSTERPWLYCPNCPCYWQADHAQERVTWEAWWPWEGIEHPSVIEDRLRLGLL
ncbi:hypothetical protein AB0L05_27780 [Nonomuraea pusilla]|uniref:hypothetical protein n=1 Tax=Nonomuraea pusilla TaxID=46177 RepID=UPI003323D9FE